MLRSSTLGLALLSTLILAGCPKKKDDAAANDAAPAAQAAVDAAATPPPCTATVAPFVIDKGARLDTGLTITHLHDGRIALGYATGEGTPKAAIVDASGKAQLLDVDVKHLLDAEKKDNPKASRNVSRVTPLGMKGMHMRVGVDMVDHGPDGSRYVRCGAADEEPTVSFKGVSHYDNADAGAPTSATGTGQGDARDCRTFSNGEVNWVLASEVWPRANSADLESRWVIDTKPGKATIDDAVIDTRDIKALPGGKQPHVDPYSFEVPVSVQAPGAGYVLAARYQGNLVVAKRKQSLEPAGKAVSFNLGAPVGMPAMAVHGGNVVLLVAEAGKTDLFGATFAAQAIPPKPTKIALDDPSPPAEGDRTSTSVAAAPSGDLYVVFTDGKFGKKRARIAVLGADLKPKTKVGDMTNGDHNVAESRVAATADGKAFVGYLEAGPDGSYAVTGAVYSCTY